jgi:signal transduction histidine kinase
MSKPKSLRYKLFFWYLVSLILLSFFIVLTVHIYQYKYSVYVLGGLFILIAAIGFTTIYKITQSIINLSSQIRQISSENLDTRISLSKNDDEISELGKSFNELLDRLDVAFKRERQFIADVAHEMKTPIATLRSSFEVTLHKERTNDEYKKIIQDSIIETDRLTATLRDVLDLAWSEVPNEMSRSKLDLSELMNEMVEIAQKLAFKKQITVSYSIASSIYMFGFRERLGRAILNIIDNAIKYTPQHGRLAISLIREINNALIIIKDNGEGISEGEIEHIFDRFYRGSKTDRVFGAGLGLAIAKATVGIHKGVIKVESKPKIGSIFAIALPLS